MTGYDSPRPDSLIDAALATTGGSSPIHIRPTLSCSAAHPSSGARHSAGGWSRATRTFVMCSANLLPLAEIPQLCSPRFLTW
jgi:hypothetical protein